MCVSAGILSIFSKMVRLLIAAKCVARSSRKFEYSLDGEGGAVRDQALSIALREMVFLPKFITGLCLQFFLGTNF